MLHSKGTEPLQVIEFAVGEFNKTKAYEWVFPVFDRDDHRTYNNALSKTAALDKSRKNDERKLVRFVGVPSVPCFEFWLLLHFADIQEFFHRDEIFRRLREHIPGYNKGAKKVYEATEPTLAAATQRATRLRERFNPFAGTDPYTNVDVLVEMLRSIRPLAR